MPSKIHISKLEDWHSQSFIPACFYCNLRTTEGPDDNDSHDACRTVPLPSLAPVSSEYQRYLETDLDGVAVAVPSQPQLQTSTPTMHEQLGPSHPHDPKFYMMRSNSSDAFLNLDGERVARVRQTQEVMPPQMSNASRTSSLHQAY